MKRVLIYKRFERFWHWSLVALIFTLAFTGFEIHGVYTVLGFERAVSWHETAAWTLIVLVIFTIFWHFTTGEWRQYLPTTTNLLAMVRFYGYGIFRNEPHPHKKTELSKLNPLQRLVYLQLKLLIFPVLLGSGVIYYYYPDLQETGIADGWLGWIAGVHVGGTYVLVAFVITHVYMTTTGHTPLSNLKAMITGYEDLDHGERAGEAPAEENPSVAKEVEVAG